MPSPAYDLFISYAQDDAAWVKSYLLDALEQSGVQTITEETFALGAPRLTEFERAIQNSAHTLLVISPAYLAENISQFIDLLAQTQDLEAASWRVVPLILKKAQLPLRLRPLVSLDATTPQKQNAALQRLLKELQRPLLPAPQPPPCPYPGMVPFSEADSARFFGRDAEIEEALQRLRLHPFLAVIGPSGIGKSSLVFAGILPALRASRLFGAGGWQAKTMRPGETPLTALQECLPNLIAPSPDQEPPFALRAAPDARTILIIDQFEEAFTLSGDQAGPFQGALRALIDAAGVEPRMGPGPSYQ